MTRSERMEAKLDRILELLGERVGVGMSDKDAPVVSYPQPPSVRPSQSIRLLPVITEKEVQQWAAVTLPMWAKEEDAK